MSTGQGDPARLSVGGVSVRLGGRDVVSEASFSVEPGEVLGVVGPNGSGKSTLLKAVLGLLPMHTGEVELDGSPVGEMRTRDRARNIAAVLQDGTGDFDLSCRDVVAMGRSPYKRFLDRDNSADKEKIGGALAMVNGTHLADRPYASLSGGERQRILIARAIAQEPRLLVMDEPTNHLDLRNQFDVLELPTSLGVTSLIALHDLNLAATYCDKVAVLSAGRVVVYGTPHEVFTEDLFEHTYEVRAQILTDDETGDPFVRFRPLRIPRSRVNK